MQNGGGFIVGFIINFIVDFTVFLFQTTEANCFFKFFRYNIIADIKEKTWLKD